MKRLRLTLVLLILVIPCQAGFIQGFDDITTLPGAGWAMTNNSNPIGSTGWFQGIDSVFPAYDGATDAYIGANFNNTGNIGTISNWLISPLLSLANGDVIKFSTRSASNVSAPFPDRLEVRLSKSDNSTDVGTTETSVGDFTTLLLSINPTLGASGYPDVWTQFSNTLGGLVGPVSGRFAFRYFVTDGGASGANSNYIGIDAVSFESAAGDIPEPTTVTLFGLGLLALGLGRRRLHGRVR